MSCVFTRMSKINEKYRRRLGYLSLCLRDVFRAIKNKSETERGPERSCKINTQGS